MSRITRPRVLDDEDIDYPTSDGKPMAETDLHRILMVALIQTLEAFFRAAPLVYVSGNLLVFYHRGDRRRHVSPDVFVVRGVPKRRRDHYLIWRERKPPEVVIELTSRTTRRDDLGRKMLLYRDVLRVKEYFLFDPRGDYLDPPLQGYRLRKGEYVPIRPVHGRLPSRILGLHLEQDGDQLRLYNPGTGRWLPTPEEARDQEAAARRQEARARRAAEAENERLRREVEELRRRLAEKHT
jgi:Uma2 family endonuclease